MNYIFWVTVQVFVGHVCHGLVIDKVYVMEASMLGVALDSVEPPQRFAGVVLLCLRLVWLVRVWARQVFPNYIWQLAKLSTNYM